LIPEKRIAYIQIHTAIFLWGFTAILGRWISLQEVPLVWYRVLITCLGLAALPGVVKGFYTMNGQNRTLFFGIGCLIALHWVAFYGSIKYSNVSVALGGLATTSLFTAFIEPLFFKKNIRPTEVFLALLVVVGIYVMFNATPAKYETGFIMGLIAALLAAVFSTLNKKYIDRAQPQAITFTELMGGFLFLTAFLPLYMYWAPNVQFVPTTNDWFFLVVLAWLCTAFTMVLSLKSLKHLSAFAANLSLNLEPVYGILLAWLFFAENKELSPNFYIGAIIIICSIFMHPVLENPEMKKRLKKLMGKQQN
jgi:drug/metabolite transporter (DMT)-like permease